MNHDRGQDIYERRSRNRRHLALALSTYTLIIMALSGLGVYVLYEAVNLETGFWLVLSLFWLCFLIYVVLHYALGFKSIFKRIRTLPPAMTDHRLSEALHSARLASGMTDDIRLLDIPSKDINAFSLSLPDGSFALFATQGIAEKLRERERVAIMAHEIAHMQAGDALMYTIMIRLSGRRAMKKTMIGHAAGEHTSLRLASILAAMAFIGWILLVSITFAWAENQVLPRFQPLDFWFAVALLFLTFAASLPLLMHKLLQMILDKEREHSADMEAVYLIRDPQSVYDALKSAADDVLDVLLLPSSFDALLFHPVVSYTSYSPFRTQPTMMERMSRLTRVYPQIEE